MAMVKLRNTFHVDRHRWMEAASWVSAYCAKAVRIASVVMLLNDIALTPSSLPTMRSAIVSKSCR